MVSEADRLGLGDQPEQRSRLGRQRRAVGQAGTGRPESRHVGNDRRRSGSTSTPCWPSRPRPRTSIATSSCWPVPRPTADADGKFRRIENFNSTKSFAGDQDFAGCVPWPRIDSHQSAMAAGSRRAVRRVGQGSEFDRPDGRAGTAEMGRAGRALARSADRAHAGRRHHAIGAARGQRAWNATS